MIVTGSPITAFVDAFRNVLIGDTEALNGSVALMGLVTGVYGHVSDRARTDFPYLVIGDRHRANDGGAMQIVGGMVSVQLDGWSAAKGPFEMQSILSRVAWLCERRTGFKVAGFAALDGSLTCEFEEVFDEPDADSPGRRLYHGVQRWTALIHESS